MSRDTDAVALSVGHLSHLHRRSHSKRQFMLGYARSFRAPLLAAVVSGSLPAARSIPKSPPHAQLHAVDPARVRSGCRGRSRVASVRVGYPGSWPKFAQTFCTHECDEDHNVREVKL